jgi:hypothetical protein
VDSRRVTATATRTNRIGIVVGVLTCAGLIIRAAGITHESLWLDEAYTLLFSRLPFFQVFTVGGAHEHPPLYYLLCHVLFGLVPSPLLPRFISMVAGTLLIPLTFLLGRRILSTTAGLVASGFIAVSPLAIWYSQDGRAYALATLFVTASYLCLFRAVGSTSWLRWALYGACVLASLYTEYTTAFALVAQILFLPRARRPFLLTWIGVVVGYLPWISVLVRNTVEVAGDYWIPSPTLDSLQATALGFLGAVTPCPSPPCSGVSPPGLGTLGPLLAILVVVFLLSMIVWTVVRPSFPRVVLLGWVLLPFAIVLALAPFRSLYLDRVFVDALPAFVLLLVAGLLALPRVLGIGLLTIVAAVNLATSPLLFTTHSNPDWRSLARDLASVYRKGDAVLYNPGVLRPLVESYLPSDWNPTRVRALWSRVYLDVPGWEQYYPLANKTDRPTRTYVESVLRNRQLRQVARSERNVWLLSLDYPGLNDTRRWFITHGYQIRMSELYDGDSRLELWSKGPPGTAGPASVPRGWSGWSFRGPVHVSGGIVHEPQHAAVVRTFPVRPGQLYSSQVVFRCERGWPLLSVDVLDAQGNVLATFPRTKWYGLPANGVWLSVPFGFITPPGAVRARITASTKWGEVDWQTIAVYHRR